MGTFEEEKPVFGIENGSITGSDRPDPTKVLLVDDEKVVQEVAAEMLDTLGYQVFCADDGIEALEVYRAHSGGVDLVLLDLTMPRMGGLECLKRLLEIDPEVKVVVSSGHHMESEREDLLREGAVDVIQKPFLLKDLDSKIRASV